MFEASDRCLIADRACFCEDRRISFGKFKIPCILLLLVCPTFWTLIWVIIVFMCRGNKQSARRASVALTLCGSGRWEALWMNRARDKKSRLERSVSNLTFQWDTYLRELQKVSVSLQEVNKVLASLNFPGTVGSQVMHMARMMEMERKTKALDSAQKELKFLRIQNASLTQKLKEFTYTSLGAVIECLKVHYNMWSIYTAH